MLFAVQTRRLEIRDVCTHDSTWKIYPGLALGPPVPEGVTHPLKLL